MASDGAAKGAGGRRGRPSDRHWQVPSQVAIVESSRSAVRVRLPLSSALTSDGLQRARVTLGPPL